LKCSQEQMNFLFVDTTNADKAMGNVQAVRYFVKFYKSNFYFLLKIEFYI